VLLQLPAGQSVTDLLRLVAVPVFGWAAYRDVRTRRIPNRVWPPLFVFAVALLAWDTYAVLDAPRFVARGFLIRVLVSVGFVVPLSYLFWRIGGFGGADAKAFMFVAVLFPVYPVYYLSSTSLPLVWTPLEVFSMTILSNTVLAGVAYPLGVAARNVARRRLAWPMFIGKPVDARSVTGEYGRLLESPDGFTRGGLDLDALRMYLQWRGTTVEALRAEPDTHRDPDSLPRVPNDPGDGSMATDGGRPAEAGGDWGTAGTADPWGAERFLDDIEGSAYGTTPDQLREGLEVVAAADEVWVSPGIPFIVPMFAGLVVSLTYGDALFALLRLVGLG